MWYTGWLQCLLPGIALRQPGTASTSGGRTLVNREAYWNEEVSRLDNPKVPGLWTPIPYRDNTNIRGPGPCGPDSWSHTGNGKTEAPRPRGRTWILDERQAPEV